MLSVHQFMHSEERGRGEREKEREGQGEGEREKERGRGKEREREKDRERQRGREGRRPFQVVFELWSGVRRDGGGIRANLNAS